MKKASVLYLFHIQCEINPSEQSTLKTGLYKSLARLDLKHILVPTQRPEPLPEKQITWAKDLISSFATQQEIPIQQTQDPVPFDAPEETCLWILNTDALKNYLTLFTPHFNAKDYDLVVVNTQKRQYRSLSF